MVSSFCLFEELGCYISVGFIVLAGLIEGVEELIGVEGLLMIDMRE